MPRRLSLLFTGILLFQLAFGQKILDHVCPRFWWTDMQNDSLQLLLHGNNIGKASVDIQYPGVVLDSVHHVKNDRYLFLDLLITDEAKPGKVPIHLQWKNGNQFTYLFNLKKKNEQDGITRATGISSKDFIYLLMPDRFANGDTTNDRVPGMLDQTLNRDSMYYRHGGDLQGVIDHLDYFNRLGITALWLNPVIINDEPQASYHGYAFTNNYEVDPRLGTNQLYVNFVKKAHEHQLKVVQDIVLNHAGDQNWIVKDPPMKNWLNQWSEYTNTTYRESPLFDPYAAKSDQKKMANGWFVPSMPDLNQRNPYVAKYLIQNAIWWVEYAGIDAYRVDTYIYSDLDFLNQFNAALLREFPKLFIFGETWVHGVAAQAYFTRNNFNIPFKSNLPGVTDFQLNFSIKNALTQKPGWTEGINKLYLTLAKDFVYKNPMNNVVFLDNHDMDRFLSTVNSNIQKFKSGFAWLLTTRGIPQMYYGDEIMMKNFSRPDGLVREDFPGGWSGDTTNKFVSAGRSKAENKMFHYIRTLAHYRQNSTALQTGKLMQYVPENNVYVYFRYDKNSMVMILMNGNNKQVNVSTSRFKERIKDFTKAKDVITGKMYNSIEHIQIGANETLVLALRQAQGDCRGSR